MRDKKRAILTGLLFFVLVFGAWAAGQKQATSEQAPVSIKYWKAGPEPIWIDYMNGYIERFETKNPNIKIEFSYYAWGDMKTKLNTAFAAHAGPDIIFEALRTVGLYAQKGQYEQLEPYLDKYKDTDDIMDQILDMGRYDGKVYGLGVNASSFLWVYRKDFFQDVGLDPAKPPVSWEEFADAAVKLTKREGDIVKRAGMLLAIDRHFTLVPMAVQNGGYYTKDRPVFNEQPWVEALDVLSALYQKRVSMESSHKKENAQDSFAMSRAAMSVAQPHVIADMIQKDPAAKDKVGFFYLKRKGREKVYTGAQFLIIGGESEHKDIGWRFIEQFITEEECWTRYKETGTIPIRKSLKDRYMKDDPYFNPHIWKGVEIGVGNPTDPWALFQVKYVRQAMAQAFLGEKSAKQALEDNYKLCIEDMKASGH